MSTTPSSKIAGWAGVFFVVVFLASEINLADVPAVSDPASEFRRWFEANTTEIAWTTLGVAASLGLFFLLFVSGLLARLSATDSDVTVWTRLAFGSAVALVALAASKAAFWPVLTQHQVLGSVSDGTLKALASIEFVMLGTIVPWAMAVFLLGASVVVVRTGVMSNWLGWFGLATALLFAIGSFWLVTGNAEGVLGLLTFVGYLGFLIWVLIGAISLIRSHANPSRL